MGQFRRLPKEFYRPPMLQTQQKLNSWSRATETKQHTKHCKLRLNSVWTIVNRRSCHVFGYVNLCLEIGKLVVRKFVSSRPEVWPSAGKTRKTVGESFWNSEKTEGPTTCLYLTLWTAGFLPSTECDFRGSICWASKEIKLNSVRSCHPWDSRGIGLNSAYDLW